MKCKIKSLFPACTMAMLLSTAISQAAVTLGATSSAQVNYQAPGGPLTWSHTIGTGDYGALLVAISYEDSDLSTIVLPESVSFGSQPLTSLGSARMTGGGFDNTVSLWHLESPNIGTANITVGTLSLANTNNNVKGHAANFFGVSSISPASTSTTGTPTALSFTGLSASSAVFVAANNQGAAVSLSFSGLTSIATLSGGGSTAEAAWATGLSGNVNVSYSGATGRTPIIGVAIIPEPSSLLLGALGMTGLLLRRRSH